MSTTTRTREQQFRKTKAQLIDELEALERRMAEPGNGGVRLRDIVENIAAGFCYYDADDRMVMCNSVYRTIFDYSKEEARPGASFADLTALDAARGSIVSDDYVRRRASQRRSGSGAFDFRLSDGRWIRIRDRRTSSGGTVSILTDITERRQAEEALRLSEQRLSSILETSPVGVSITDAASKRIVLNQRYADLIGVPREELLGGQAINVWKHAKDRDEYARRFAQDGRVVDMEFELRRGDGSSLWVMANAISLEFSGDPVRVNWIVDLSGRKRAEEAVRESREQLQALADNLPEFISMKDSDERFIFVNKQFEEWVCQGRDDVVGKTVFDIYSDDQANEFHALDRQVIDSREVLSEEIDLPYPDGKTRAIIRTRFPVISSKGEMLGLGTVNHDITERKRAEEELAEKEAQLRLALDNMPGGMMLGDRDLNYVLFNSQYSELFEFPDGLVRVGGSSRDGFRYQADRGDLGPGDKDDLIEEVAATYRRGEAVSYEREIAGSGRTVQVYLAPTPEGGYVTIVTDITERKRAEQALKESTDHFRAVSGSANDAIVSADSRGNIMMWNRGAERIFGYSGDEIVGQPLIKIIPESYRERHLAGIKRYRGSNAESGAGGTLEFEGLHKDGHLFPVELSVATWLVGGDRFYSGILRDITERKQAEEALLEAKRRAEEASKLVAEKNRMLESLSNQLSKYLSPQVYASIFAGKQSIEIASKRKKLTVFFSDIADFTATTDSLESEELTNLLNHYLTEMSKIALDHGATIDKYVGDAIIAFFGDPETRGVKEDARACVNMAIAMQRRMRELQFEWLDMGLEQPFQVRMGINTGFCTVGNFGSGDRMDYTIIGNEVNLAARLEALAEVGDILMAHETHSLVKDTIMAEEGNTLTVKGFAKPVRTYSVVGLYDDLAEQGRIIRKEQGGVRVLVDMQKGDKAGAIRAVEDVLSELKG